MLDLTLNILVLRLVALVFIVAVHGAAVAATAVALGDEGPRHDGRLTLNPFAHLDPIGTLAGTIYLAGWMKPMAIDPKHLRPGRLGLPIIITAGIAVTLAAVLVLRLARPLILPLLPDTASQTVFALIETVSQMSLWFALLNLWPIPCLTGCLWLDALAPAWRERLRHWQLFCAPVLLLLLGFGVIRRKLGPAYDGIANLLGW